MNNIIKELAPQVNKVISYSQSVPDKVVNSIPLLEKWYKSKSHFIHALEDELIYEFPEPISVNLTDTQKELKAANLAEFIGSNYGNQDLCNFIFSFKKDFFNNKLPKDYTYKDKVIPKGMKLIKAFKYFEEDKKTLSAMQDYASTVIQENKITGKLCISVHPLDYLSSSENTYKWRSCHSLNGEYRAGNLSYMCDTSTIICYIKGEEEVKLPNFPSDVLWNSKKWRVLLNISDYKDIVFAGRQYPFSSMDLLNKIKDILISKTKILAPWGYSNWSNELITSWTTETGNIISFNRPYIPLPGDLVRLNDLVKDKELPEEEVLHFNDILYSTCSTPYYFYDLNTRFTYYKPISVGCNEVPCTICGNDDLYDSNSLFCEDCHYKYEEDSEGHLCDSCGSYSHDLVYVEDIGEELCGFCLDEICSMCEECGEFYIKEKVSFDKETGKMICEYCKGEH